MHFFHILICYLQPVSKKFIVYNLSGNHVRSSYYPRSTGAHRAPEGHVNQGFHGTQTSRTSASYGPRPVTPLKSRRNLLLCTMVSVIGVLALILVVGAVIAIVLGTRNTNTTSQGTTRAPVPTIAPQSTLPPQPPPTTQAPRPQTTQQAQPTTPQIPPQPPHTTQSPRPQTTQQPQRPASQTPQPLITTPPVVEGDIFNTGICGTRPVLNNRILGGTDAELGHGPWIGSLQTDSSHGCGVTLINSRWAVTAAHCIVDDDQVPDTVVFGFTDLTNPGSSSQETGILAMINHDMYDPQSANAEYDISLLYLSETIEFTSYVRPLCLATLEQETSVYQNCKAIGWGALSEPTYSSSADPAEYPDILQEVDLPLIGSSSCQSIDDTLTDNHICAAATTQGGFDTCQGDSGGPLACESTRDNQWHLVGITSTGEGCGRPNVPSIFTRVSQFISWIQTNVAQYN
ncbi:chymotrypsin-like protease CTRL-1 isoform X2 [Amphiura filiformis]|uniref:chymotrypsin-like protease CTRL-1 isoform X2 n=1 Tax=Amphiura filiformis TaxID=82378 RepID=UPI003B21C3FE